jgi:clan AA aspartic protease
VIAGTVDDYGRALVRIVVRHPDTAATAEWDAWIDTGFTGDLLLLPDQISALDLPAVASVRGATADGSHVIFATHACLLEWLGQIRRFEALAGAGRFALIGVRLIEDCTLTIDYPNRTVLLKPAPATPILP